MRAKGVSLSHSLLFPCSFFLFLTLNLIMLLRLLLNPRLL